MGVVVRRYNIYRFPYTTYPYSCICSFFQQHPYFLFIFLNVFRSLCILRSETDINLNCHIPSLDIPNSVN